MRRWLDLVFACSPLQETVGSHQKSHCALHPQTNTITNTDTDTNTDMNTDTGELCQNVLNGNCITLKSSRLNISTVQSNAVQLQRRL